MALRAPEVAPEQDVNYIDDNYARGLDQGLSEMEKGRAGVFATSDAAEQARQRLGGEGSSSNLDSVDDIKNREGQGSDPSSAQEEEPSGIINNYTGNKNASQNQGLLGRAKGVMSGGKGPLGVIGALLGIGGIGIILLIPMLLSLKMFGLVANIQSAASAIPSYAVEQRTEYLITRAYATWLIKKGAGEAVTDSDTAAVFCKGASIGCSLTWTRINEYFDSRYELSNWEDIGIGDNKGRKVTITPKGRDSLGAFARSWDVRVEMSLGGNSVDMQYDTITRNAVMKQHIRDHVSNKMHTSSIISRYIARKGLMKRYGVTNFRGFERTSNAIAEKRAAFKASMLRNTLGKISPKSATYIACISEGAGCDTLRSQFRAQIDESPRRVDETDVDYGRRIERNKTLSNAVGEAIDITPDTKVTKFISKQLLTKLGGAVAIAGVIDMIMGIVETADDGAIDAVMYDIRATAYVGYAFGDEAGFVTNIEKIKAGEEGVDPELMELLAEQMEDVEQSPIFQAETGLMNNNTATGAGYARICDNNGKQEEVVLTGSYACPERQVAPSVTSFMDKPYMKLLADVAAVWNNSVGLLFQAAGWIGEQAMKVSGIDRLIDAAIGSKFEDLAGWIIGLFFDVPPLGDEATGDQNYDAMSAGVWIAQNGIMENGVENGDLLGAGGGLLTNEEIAAVQRDYRSQELEHFNSQSYLARIFNTDLRDSFASRLLATMPLSTFKDSKGIFTLPSTALASLPSVFSSPARAELGPLNPHNIPLYGYAPGDPVLTADPTDPMFDEENCKISAKEREDSYGIHRDLYPIKVYTKSDPCALERVAIGNILHDMGVTDDKHSFEELDGSLHCGPLGSSTGGATGPKMSSTEFDKQLASYGLEAPSKDTRKVAYAGIEIDIPGYEVLLEKLESDPNAGWAAQQMLNGEKAWKAAGGEVKEYMNTGWLWYENGSSGWPDPYEINCNDNRDGYVSEVSSLCRATNFQVAGYQAYERRTNYVEVFKKLYDDDELPSVLQQVVSNSSKASKAEWNYNDPGQQKGLVSSYLDEIDKVTLDDIAPNEDFFDERAQFFTLMLGKDPAMAAALNSFAVTDTDVVQAFRDCTKLPWSGYICDMELLMSNMMYALYLFDGQGPAGGADCSSSRGPRGTGEGIRAIWGGVGEKNLAYGFEVVPSAESGASSAWYSYGKKFGTSGSGHTGTDIPMDPYAPVYSPVEGIVVCERNGVGPGANAPQGPGCAGAADYSKTGEYGCSNGARPDTMPGGAGTIMIEVTENGNKTGEYLVLGHMAGSDVKVGERVTPNQQVGLAGCMNGWHTHVEYYLPDSGPSKLKLVDPVKYL